MKILYEQKNLEELFENQRTETNNCVEYTMRSCYHWVETRIIPFNLIWYKKAYSYI